MGLSCVPVNLEIVSVLKILFLLLDLGKNPVSVQWFAAARVSYENAKLISLVV